MEKLNSQSDPFYPRTDREYFGQLVSGLIVFIKQSPSSEVSAVLAKCIADLALTLNFDYYEKSSGPSE